MSGLECGLMIALILCIIGIFGLVVACIKLVKENEELMKRPKVIYKELPEPVDRIATENPEAINENERLGYGEQKNR